MKKLLLIILLTSISSISLASSFEHEYRSALGNALENRLDEAEKKFSNLLLKNPEHSRIADALFWLARVQFMKGDYRAAANTFQKFLKKFPQDSRAPDVMMYFAETVSYYATPAETCKAYNSVVTEQFLNDPSRIDELIQLSEQTGCTTGEIAELADRVRAKTEEKQNEVAQREKRLAQSTIPGAFGILLGETFNGKEITLRYDSGEAAYAFEPQNANESFTHYGVFVTPVTQTVYKIIAANLDGKGCESERKVVEVLLDKKYTTIKEDETLSGHSNYSLGSRRISLYCAWGGQLTLTYEDKELEKLNIQEIASKRDGSGF